MRIRTALAALALATAGLLGGAPTASAIEFGDIIVSSEASPDVVAGCNAGSISLSPSAQCGVFHISPV